MKKPLIVRYLVAVRGLADGRNMVIPAKAGVQLISLISATGYRPSPV
jgi:hypothetical protein